MTMYGFRNSIPVRKRYGFIGMKSCWNILRILLIVGYAKYLRNFSFLFKRYKAITVCWCKQPTSKRFLTCLYYIYLFKLYKLIITLLKNDFINICSEISKIRLILWMIYTCSVKGLEEVEKLGRSECAVDRWYQ